MKDRRGDCLWRGFAFVLVVLSGTTSGLAASGNDPNAASESALDLSRLNISTVQEILTKVYTVNGTRPLDLVFRGAYEDDLKKAREVIGRVPAADPRLLAEPAPLVAVSALADSSVNFVGRLWVSVADYWPTYSGLTAKIKVALEENGVTIPFPQRDVHIKQGSPVSGGN